MEGSKKILAISGSTKKHSTNASILKFIAESFKEQLEVEIYQEIDQLPHFNPDLDVESPGVLVKDLRERIQTADGVIFCTPEYVFSLPGSLKNAIEWTVSTTVFSNKPVAIIVAAASGDKALESLHLIMTTIEARIAEMATLLIKGAKGKIGRNGEIKDEETAERIKALVCAFINLMETENPVPSKYQQQ